jgi:hypothetical protein
MGRVKLHMHMDMPDYDTPCFAAACLLCKVAAHRIAESRRCGVRATTRFVYEGATAVVTQT